MTEKRDEAEGINKQKTPKQNKVNQAELAKETK